MRVDPGRHDPDKSSSRVLSFVNPMLDELHARRRRECQKFSHRSGNQITTFSLAPGALILFPSWVLHDVVSPLRARASALPVAFNCWFKLRNLG